MLKKISNLVLHKILFNITEYNKPDLSSGKYILCPNHTSNFDGPIFWASHPQIRIMAKKELFDIPVVKTILKKVDVVPVDRKANPMEALRSAKHYMQEDEDKVFLMFPQGTVSDINLNKLSRIKPGAFFLSSATKAPIIPVFIEQPRLFRKTRIVYGENIIIDNKNSQIHEKGKYSYYRQLWQDEILKLQEEAEHLEKRKVRKIKLDKKHINNNN